MPGFGQTPEALLARKDSKNPSTTCKGITSSGRPCRRALNRTVLKAFHQSSLPGSVALIHEDGRVQAVDFYCWQHKGQAEEESHVQWDISSVGGRSIEVIPLQRRESIDTLFRRLGLNDTKRRTGESKGITNIHDAYRPGDRDEKAGFSPSKQSSRVRQEQRQIRPRNKQAGLCEALCCVGVNDDDYIEIVRHRRRTLPSERNATSHLPSENIASSTRQQSTQFSNDGKRVAVRQETEPESAHRLRLARLESSGSRTNQLLSLLPANISPHIASTLLAELSKPPSAADEPGYIYIFWLTPQSRPSPPEDTARAILSTNRPHHGRRISDVMTEFSYDGTDDRPPQQQQQRRTRKKKTIMLKIGRASNITRRMNQWQRQCGYALTLVQWYPHIPSASSPAPQPSPNGRIEYPDLSRPPSYHTSRRQSAGETVHTVPFVKRVERLIHLELAAQQVKQRCDACGREHREWFEVEATQAAVRAVDETVKRWVTYSEEYSLQSVND